MTQTMTKQVDVGFGAAPFGLDKVESGEARIIATGNDVAALRTRVVRVNLTGADTLKNKHDAHRALHAGLSRRRSIGCIPAPMRLKSTANIPACRQTSCSGCSSSSRKRRCRPTEVKGLDAVMADAVAQKFLSAPLTPDQIKELIQIPK